MLRILLFTSSLLLTVSASYYSIYSPQNVYTYRGYQPSYSKPVAPKIYRSKITYSQPLETTSNLAILPTTYKKTSVTRISPSTGSSSNIATVTRQQTEGLKTILNTVSMNPTASRYINQLFTSGTCIKTLEDAITAIETGTTLIENAEPELTKLASSLNSITDTSDVAAATRVSAEILLQMEALLPKLTPRYSTCGSTSEVTFEALNTVGQVLKEISVDSSIFLSQVTRQKLVRSQTIVDSVTLLMKQLKSTFSDLSLFCTSDTNYNIKALSSMASMLDQLAELFTTLGAKEKANSIRQNSSFTQKIVAAVQNSDVNQLLSLDCNKPGDFSSVAQALNDIADLIDEVGIETLKQQIGLADLF